MNNPTIKYLGLISMTKGAYVVAQVTALALVAILFLVTFFTDLDKYLLGDARLVLLVVFILELAEMFVMMNKYKRKSVDATK